MASVALAPFLIEVPLEEHSLVFLSLLAITNPHELCDSSGHSAP
jgi:hypothetical protein